jgi:hypothetical protein
VINMSEKIYVDISQPATLLCGTKLIDCPTLGEAVLAFDRLPEGDREQATIKVNTLGGATYTAEEIDRLHVAPKKKDARDEARRTTANVAKHRARPDRPRHPTGTGGCRP